MKPRLKRAHIEGTKLRVWIYQHGNDELFLNPHAKHNDLCTYADLFTRERRQGKSIEDANTTASRKTWPSKWPEQPFNSLFDDVFTRHVTR